MGAEAPGVFLAGGNQRWSSTGMWVERSYVLMSHVSEFSRPRSISRKTVASGAKWQRPDSNSQLERCSSDTSQRPSRGRERDSNQAQLPVPGPSAALPPLHLPSGVSETFTTFTTNSPAAGSEGARRPSEKLQVTLTCSQKSKPQTLRLSLRAA